MSASTRQAGNVTTSSHRQRFVKNEKLEVPVASYSSRRPLSVNKGVKTTANHSNKYKERCNQKTVPKKDSVLTSKAGKLSVPRGKELSKFKEVKKRQTPKLNVTEADSNNDENVKKSEPKEKLLNSQLQGNIDEIDNSKANSTCSVDASLNDKIKWEFSNILNELYNVHMPTFQRKLEHIKNKREENTQVGNEIKEQITSRASVLKEMIDNVMIGLIREADDIRNIIDQELNETQNVLELTLSDLKSEAEKCKLVNEKEETENVLESTDAVQSRVRELIPKQCLKATKLPVFTTPSKSEGTDTLRDMFGKVSFNNVTEDGNYIENSLTENSKVEIEILSSFNNGKDAIASICALNSSSAFIRTVGSNSLNLIHSTGKIIKTVKATTKINAFAVSPDGTLYMSCPDDQDIKKTNPDGSVEIFKKLYPLKSRWICVTESCDILVSVVDAWSYKLNPNSRRLVKKYSKEGKLLKNIEYENKQRLFQNPQKVTSSGCGDIGVVDQIGDYKGKIVIVDKAGKLKLKYSGPSREKSAVNFDPSDLCFNQDCSIIVADQASQSIHLVNKNGTFLKYLYSANLSIVTSLKLVSPLDNVLWIGFQNGDVKITKLVM